MLRMLAPLAALILLGAIVLATDRPRPRPAFTFANHAEINTLDPQKMTWMYDLRAGRMLFEGLVRPDLLAAEPTILPAAAESWEASPDGRAWTFHLRAAAQWSSGEPVRASDFVYTWRRALLPDTACDYTGVFQLIAGGKEFFDWRAAALAAFKPGDDADALWRDTESRFAATVGLRAPDDRTLIVTLAHPVPYFLDLCAFPVFFPVYPPLVSRYETLDPATGRIVARSGWTKPGILVSSGPFTLTSWRFKRDMDFERSATYWDRARVAFPTVRCVCIEDTTAQVLAARAGDIDWLSDAAASFRSDMLADRRAFEHEHAAQIAALQSRGLSPADVQRALPPDSRDRIHAVPTFGVYFYNFNCAPKLLDGRANPFADRRVRRAFALALDKQRITEQVRRIGEPVAATLIPPGAIPGYESPAGLARDPVEARRLLAEAGYPAGRGFPTVEFLYTRDAGHELIIQSARKDWDEVLGVSVSLSQREIKTFKNDLRKGNFMLSRASWFGDYLDPTTFLDINRARDGNNDRQYSSPEFDDLLDQAGRTTDRPARMALLSRAEKIIIHDDLPLLPIFQYLDVSMYDPHRLGGLTSNPRQDQMLDRMFFLPAPSGSGVAP